MITFKSASDLRQLPPDDPAQPVVAELVRVLINAYTEPGQTYNAEDYGYIVLIEDGDQDQPLTGIDWDEYTLSSIPWEGITREGDFFVAIVLCNDDYGLVFVIPEPLVGGELRQVINDNLDPPIDMRKTGDLI